MNTHERFVQEKSAPEPSATAQPYWLVRAWLGLWRKWSDYDAAASAYEHLSRLSDIELKHRGLSRDILARDLSETCNQGSFIERPVLSPDKAPQPVLGRALVNIRSNLGGKARALQTAGVALALLALLAVFVHSLRFSEGSPAAQQRTPPGVQSRSGQY